MGTAIVETSFGKLRGIQADGVYLFRGVPFAQPPSGDLRFRAPRQPTPWAGVRDATVYGAAAPQAPDPLPIAAEAEHNGQSEDCLRLNIWTSGLDEPCRPVLVWIHGGSFLRGSASVRALDGALLARRGDAVVVAIQYRLGAFGFLYLGDLCDREEWPANLALRDQIAALQWVRREIGAFGGDPSNVTVFGQSAGAICIGCLLGAPAARGLFDRAILQSGPPEAVSPADATPVAEALLRGVGATTRNPSTLRDVSIEQLLAVEPQCRAASGRRPLGLPFVPVIDGDLLPCHPMEVIAAGGARNTSLLVGTTLDEMTLFLLIDGALPSLDDEAVLMRSADLIGGPDASDRAREVVDTYRRVRAARGERTDSTALWLAIKRDWYVRHPIMRAAELQGGHRTPTHAYLFTWPSPFMDGVLGACHGLELPFVFGTLHEPILSMVTGTGPDAIALAEAMQNAWLSFARTGSPSSNGLRDWPAYTAKERATMVLASDCRVRLAPMEEERRVWEGIRYR